MASLNARTKLRTLGKTVNFVSDTNFAGHSTIQDKSLSSVYVLVQVPHNINIAMTKVTERWDGDAEPQKSQAADSDLMISSQA
ncbi:hypothetical protein DXG01_016526 [Tephrocybe rancida]|nr:hypothetical protein DXG01_016526 [Tephrocybe rancida]